MIDCTLCNILKTLKQISANAMVGGQPVGLDCVTLGFLPPSKVKAGSPRVTVWWDGNFSDHVDNYERHIVKVMLGVLSKSDPSNTTEHEEDLLQATAVFFAIRKAWIKAAHDLAGSGLGTDGGAGVLHMESAPGGAEPGGFDGRDRVGFVGQYFQITFNEDLPE